MRHDREPGEPKTPPKGDSPKGEAEPPLQVEGGEAGPADQQPAPEPPGGMIGEGGGAAREEGREGGMIGQG